MEDLINLLETELETVNRRIERRNGSCYHDETNKLNILDGQVRGLEKAIEIVKQYDGWIPVSERLPLNEKRVLICTKRRRFDGKIVHTVTTGMHEDGKMFTDNSGFSWEENDFEYDEEADDYIIPEGWYEQNMYCEEFGIVDDSVIAWQPLPEPYKEV